MRQDVFYHSKEHARHTLFSGTKVVQTRFYDDEKVSDSAKTILSDVKNVH